MLYVVTWHCVGLTAQCGFVSRDEEEATACLRDNALLALEFLGDYALVCEWYDEDGEMYEPGFLELEGKIRTAESDWLPELASQLDDILQSERLGYLQQTEFPDVFEFAKEEGFESWGTPRLVETLREMARMEAKFLEGVNGLWAD